MRAAGIVGIVKRTDLNSRAVLLLPPLVAGALLRAWGISRQVLGGDEFHALWAATDSPLREILTTYRSYDNCIPLTAFYKLWIALGGHPTEIGARLPLLLGGVALVAIGPWLLWRKIGGSAATVLAWLLAVSPMLVLYSRMARPYALVCVLVLLAVVAFESFMEHGGARRALAYALPGALAAYFHLGALPVVLAPLLFAMLWRFVQRRAGERLWLPAAGITVAVAAFVIPARSSLAELVTLRAGDAQIGFDTLRIAAGLQAGATWVLPLLVFWGLAFVGALRLAQRDRRLGALLVMLVVTQWVAIFVLSPSQSNHALVFQRYVLPVLPLTLVLVACGLDPGSSRIRAGVAAAFVGALFLAGPLASRSFADGSFTQSNDFVSFDRNPRLASKQLPEFYAMLAATRPRGEVIEYPWHPWWIFSRVYGVYQGLHRWPTRVASPASWSGREAFRFRNQIDPAPEALLAGGGSYFVVHLDPIVEQSGLLVRGTSLYDDVDPRYLGELRNAFRAAAGEQSAMLTALWGPPDREEKELRVWDLDRVRAESNAP
jgi:hypothetical protein